MTSSSNTSDQPVHAGEISKKEADAGVLPSHGISLDTPGNTELGRPPIVQYLSSPAHGSPIRHHRRHPSQHREVKETLNARSEYTNNHDDGKAERRINQYQIKDEIGRGSFGAVHLAVDQYGKEYAVKEFSKSRLRKRAQSNILRRQHADRRPGHLAAGSGFNAPMHRYSVSDVHDGEEKGNPLYLIKEEIAIMKKLNHPNLVSLIEVLDDPEEDSLYMVLEMCKKGVVMKVGLGQKSDPYDIEDCRCWFRDLILGIEYLHAQGVVHRDIKPDNLLLTEDYVLKIVDFGVSEMFEKQSEMMTAKSAGSPAFLPPELCVTKHGDISGKAADIWSMGISLYCLRFGRIPFEQSGVLELYEAIKNDNVDIEPNNEPQFVDLLRRILEKDPKKRITMTEIRDHPWVTKNGTDPLLSAEQNTANLVEPPSELEVNHAITAKMRNLLVMMKSVKKFKSLLEKKRPGTKTEALGKGVRMVKPPLNMDSEVQPKIHKSRSCDLYDRSKVESFLAAEGVHHDDLQESPDIAVPKLSKMDSSVIRIVDQASIEEYQGPLSESGTANVLHTPEHPQGNHSSLSDRGRVKTPHTPKNPLDILHHESSGEKGHAVNPLEVDPPILGIGLGSQVSLLPQNIELVSESPTAAEFSIYDTAYQEEVDRIRSTQGQNATVYLNRRVDSVRQYIADENMVDAPKASDVKGLPQEGWKELLDRAREKSQIPEADQSMAASTHVQLEGDAKYEKDERIAIVSSQEQNDACNRSADNIQSTASGTSNKRTNPLRALKHLAVEMVKGVTNKKVS